MRSVLELPTQRQIKIIEMLATNDDWITISELASTLGVATKTISEDIKMLRETWKDEIEIESSFVYGVKLAHTSTSVLFKIFSELYADSVSVKWIQLVFYHPYKDLKFYAEQLHVSQSTLYRLFTKINDFFSEYNVCLNRKHSVYFFTSTDEGFFRRIITMVLIDVFGESAYNLMSSQLLNTLQARVSKIIFKDSEKASGWELYYYVIYYYVSLIRETQGFTLESNVLPVKRSSNSFYEDLLGLSIDFPKVRENHVKSIEANIRYQFEGWKDVTEQVEVEEAIHEFAETLLDKLNITDSEEKIANFKRALSYIYLETRNYGEAFSNLFNRFSYFTVKLKKEKLSVYTTLREQVELLSEQLNIDMTIHIDMIVYWVVTDTPEVLLFHLPQKILVISDISVTHAKFLAEFLTYNVTNTKYSDITFDYTVKSKLKNFKIEEYHLLISNYLILDNKIESELIDDYPTGKDISRIKSRIESSTE